MNVKSLAPLGTDRRLALQIVRDAVRHPRDVRHRVNRTNLAAWRRFRATVVRCNICGHRGTLLHEMLNREIQTRHRIGPLRETLRCRGCLSKMRDRTVAAGLLTVMADKYGVRADTVEELVGRIPGHLRILDTDANGRIGRLLATHPGCVLSLLKPELEIGASLGPGIVNVDLERIPFPDDSFDLVITSEVMEHVRHLDAAHREIARCLRDGGTYLFTVPYDATLASTWQLIDPDTDEELVQPPHIHGDPGLRAEGIKSYRVFGRDVVDQLRVAGLEAEFVAMERPDVGIFSGDLFVANKH